jgi:hypothetical protein
MQRQLILTFLVAVGLGIGTAAADQPLNPASLTPCPYTPAEIEAALGIGVSPGESSDMKFPGGRDVGCIYTKVGGSTQVVIRQVWDPSSQASVAGAKKGKPVPGDPDGAETTRGGGRDGGPRVELRYHRDKVQVMLAVDGRSFVEADIEPKLIRMRRVPGGH